MRRMVLLCVLLSGVVGTRAAPAAPPPAQAGFPRQDATGPLYSSPTVANIDADSALEVVLGDSGACVWAWNSDGSVVAGFPWLTDMSCAGPAAINAPLAIGDIDGDGAPEIVAGTQGVGPNANQRGEVWAWNSAGSSVGAWPKEMSWNQDKAVGTPTVTSVALANTIGDGALEVLYTTNNNALNGQVGFDIAANAYMRQGDATLIPVYPTWGGIAPIYGALAVGDITCDAYPDLITGRDHNYLHAYDNGARQPLNWPVRTYLDPSRTNPATDPTLNFPRSAPAVGDLNNDGTLEIVASGQIRSASHVVTGTGIIVVNADGTRAAGWSLPVIAGAPLTSTLDPLNAVALADLNADSTLEIVANLPDGTMRAYRFDGTLLWSYDYAQGALLFASEPVIGDISGDGQVDIVFGTYSPDGAANAQAGVVALSADGQLLPDFPLSLDAEQGQRAGVRAAPTLADLDGDGDVEIVAASLGGTLYAWDLPTPYQADRMPWPTARHDNWRTGNVNGGPHNLSSPVPSGPHRVFLPLLRRC